MTWSIEYEDRRVARELEDLPEPVGSRVSQAITALSENPLPAGVKKLKGQRFTVFRIRVGDYRVFYALESGRRTVVITKIGHRREIYR